MAKDIEINVRTNTSQAKQGFDGLNVSAKDLQMRIADLDKQMQMLLASQGKNAYQSKEGIRITRERTLALEQLLTMENQVATATTRSMNLAGTFSKRELKLFATSMLYATDVTGKFSKYLTHAFAGIMVGGYAGAGLAATGMLLTGLTEKAKEFDDALKKLGDTTLGLDSRVKLLKEQLEGLRRPDFWGSVQIYGKAAIFGLANAIEYVNDKAWQLKNTLAGGLIMKTYGKGYLGNLQQELETLQNLQSSAVSKKEAMSYTDDIKKKQEEIDEILGRQNKKLKEQVNLEYEIWKSLMRPYGIKGFAPNKQDTQLEERQKLEYDIWRSMVRPYGQKDFDINQPGEEVQLLNEQREQDMKQFAQSSASVFSMNMNQAWESIFGEANSMFEQMLSNWQSMLFEKIGFGIFNMLFGGIDLFGFARGITSGQATAGKYRMNQ